MVVSSNPSKAAPVVFNHCLHWLALLLLFSYTNTTSNTTNVYYLHASKQVGEGPRYEVGGDLNPVHPDEPVLASQYLPHTPRAWENKKITIQFFVHEILLPTR